MSGPRTIDIVGQRFERLTVIELSEIRGGNAYWICQCDCGARKIVAASNLNRGNVKSCGCLRREIGQTTLTKHGLTVSNIRLMRVWNNIKYRCENRNASAFANYGGRGIRVCEGLHDFATFLELIGDRPTAEHSIDRIDNEKGYSCGACNDCIARREPMNVRWSTLVEQARNKRNNVMLEHDGMRLCLAEWAQRIGVEPHVISGRLKRGWSIASAVTAKERT